MNKGNLILIGGGGHCKSVLDIVIRTKQYDNIYILDPKIAPGTKILGCATVIGNDDLLHPLYQRGEKYAFVSVGSIKSSILRSKLYYSVLDIGFNVPNIIDPSSVVSISSVLGGTGDERKKGAGIFIGKAAIINADVLIDRGVIINTAAVIEHECRIGAFSHISVNAVLCGQVEIGEYSFIGAGSTVIQGIKIGSNTIVGAGSVVLRNVKDGEKVAGIIK